MKCFPLCSVQVIQSDFARLQAETEAAEEAAKAEYEEFMEDSQVRWKLDFGGFKRLKLIGFVVKKKCMVKSCCLLWQNSMSELMVGENLLSTLKIFNV